VLVGRRQEQVPQAALARPLLELLDHRRRAPRLAGGDLLAEARLRRVHVLVHEREQLLAQREGRGVEREVHAAP
jgi:hypothetical protein